MLTKSSHYGTVTGNFVKPICCVLFMRTLWRNLSYSGILLRDSMFFLSEHYRQYNWLSFPSLLQLLGSSISNFILTVMKGVLAPDLVFCICSTSLLSVFSHCDFSPLFILSLHLVRQGFRLLLFCLFYMASSTHLAGVQN